MDSIEKVAKEQLKDCPFCGSSARYGSGSYPNHVFCDGCRASSDSAKEWNSRPLEDAIRSQVKKEQEKVIQATLGPRIENLVKDRVKKETKELVEALEEYGEHDDKCILSQNRASEQREDGYYCLYGYGKDEKWYRSDNMPQCQCGFSQTLQQFKERNGE